MHVKIIVGSTREGRFSESLIPWLTETASELSGMEVEVLDLRDYPMPFFDSASSPATITDGDYGHETINQFAAKIREADAVVMITPEYNRGPSAVLKNAIDSIYHEWGKKPLGIVTYGSVGGARAAEQLRTTAIELQMAPIRQGVHIMAPWTLRDESGQLVAGALDGYTASLKGLYEQLQWWGTALKSAREAAAE